MNPCPCGHLNDPQENCRCTQDQIQRYRMKISGPILDRIDMHVAVPRLPYTVLSTSNHTTNENSTSVRMRVIASRQRQILRANKINAKLNNKEIKKYCKLDNQEQKMLDLAVQELKLSARSYHRILKVALTIADLAAANHISTQHLTEALSFR